MFVLTTLLYPLCLAVLCVGAGLLVDRVSGGFLPAALLPAVGAAALIAVSQLSTYVPPLAPLTPGVMAAVAVAGFALAWRRLSSLARGLLARPWQLAVPVLVYGLALAPVLLAGRPTFSSYQILSDSAIHMAGADFLIHHGQDYAHLDLHNSYGRYINAYYNTSYPSGSDTLFGGSAFLLGLPLIWAFQPFNAFMLATAGGPAWLLLRRMGLDRGWAALGAFTATLPALVYAYELIGSIKEITSLPLVLTLGALVAVYPRWLRRGPSSAIPLALVAGGGISALGAGFGAWALATAVIALAIGIASLRAGRQGSRQALLLLGAGAAVTLLSALPTWIDLSGSLQVAKNIASTPNPGNLHTPLHPIQVVGAWLHGTYKQLPTSGNLTATYVLIAITLLACLAGVVHILRRRQYPLAGWLALTLAVWLAFLAITTTWVNAKAMMLTSPVVMLLAWGGVGALQASRLRLAAPLLAVALAGGVLASDVLQYHASNLAPTARYEELARVNTRFAGMGPTLVTDFDEYSLYALRDMDVGGPNFEIPPPAFARSEQAYHRVELDRVPPAGLLAYPLIVTRRDPSANRPPSAYRLLWHGAYYNVWGRRRSAPAAIADLGLSGSLTDQCAQIKPLAGLARTHGAQLIAASSPQLLPIPLANTSHPAHWGHLRAGLVMSTPGRLSAVFTTPSAGVWELWFQGQIMPTVSVDLDGRPFASIAAQLGGNSLVLNTLTPLRVSLSAGRHRLSVTRKGLAPTPGDGGSAILFGIFLTPAPTPPSQPLHVVPPSRWRSLCGRSLQWIEVARA